MPPQVAPRTAAVNSGVSRAATKVVAQPHRRASRHQRQRESSCYHKSFARRIANALGRRSQRESHYDCDEGSADGEETPSRRFEHKSSRNCLDFANETKDRPDRQSQCRSHRDGKCDSSDSTNRSHGRCECQPGRDDAGPDPAAVAETHPAGGRRSARANTEGCAGDAADVEFDPPPHSPLLGS